MTLAKKCQSGAENRHAINTVNTAVVEASEPACRRVYASGKANKPIMPTVPNNADIKNKIDASISNIIIIPHQRYTISNAFQESLQLQEILKIQKYHKPVQHPEIVKIVFAFL